MHACMIDHLSAIPEYFIYSHFVCKTIFNSWYVLSVPEIDLICIIMNLIMITTINGVCNFRNIILN